MKKASSQGFNALIVYEGITYRMTGFRIPKPGDRYLDSWGWVLFCYTRHSEPRVILRETTSAKAANVIMEAAVFLAQKQKKSHYA